MPLTDEAEEGIDSVIEGVCETAPLLVAGSTGFWSVLEVDVERVTGLVSGVSDAEISWPLERA